MYISIFGESFNSLFCAVLYPVMCCLFFYFLLLGIIGFNKNQKRKRNAAFIACAICLIFAIALKFSQDIPSFTLVIALFSIIAAVILIRKSAKFIILSLFLFVLAGVQVTSFVCFMYSSKSAHPVKELKNAEKLAIFKTDKNAIYYNLSKYLRKPVSFDEIPDALADFEKYNKISSAYFDSYDFYELYAYAGRPEDAIKAGCKSAKCYLFAGLKNNMTDLTCLKIDGYQPFKKYNPHDIPPSIFNMRPHRFNIPASIINIAIMKRTGNKKGAELAHNKNVELYKKELAKINEILKNADSNNLGEIYIIKKYSREKADVENRLNCENMTYNDFEGYYKKRYSKEGFEIMQGCPKDKSAGITGKTDICACGNYRGNSYIFF